MVVVFTLGVFLTRSAGCAINDFADYKFDAQVARTKARPLAAGHISRKQALMVTAVLSLAAFGLALEFLQLRTLLWSVPALGLFISYPFMKRFFPLPQLYLGIAFSFGILMAFIEAQGSITLGGWLIFLANLSWVLAYDTIYALVDLEDDLVIGIKTSAITFGRYVTSAIMLAYGIFLLLLVIVGLCEEFKWVYYLSLILAGGMMVYVRQLIKTKNRDNYFHAFLFNNYIGLAVMIGIILSYQLT
jgi:4-hydroxybenzoate polyprenyltransferase